MRSISHSGLFNPFGADLEFLLLSMGDAHGYYSSALSELAAIRKLNYWYYHSSHNSLYLLQEIKKVMQRK
jgi:hypothetical protein